MQQWQLHRREHFACVIGCTQLWRGPKMLESEAILRIRREAACFAPVIRTQHPLQVPAQQPTTRAAQYELRKPLFVRAAIDLGPGNHICQLFLRDAPDTAEEIEWHTAGNDADRVDETGFGIGRTAYDAA